MAQADNYVVTPSKLGSISIQLSDSTSIQQYNDMLFLLFFLPHI
jgi:hypothetical protein